MIVVRWRVFRLVMRRCRWGILSSADTKVSFKNAGKEAREETRVMISDDTFMSPGKTLSVKCKADNNVATIE